VSPEVAALLGGCTRRRLWAEQDEGPYYRSAQPERRDVVEDRSGAPLRLGVRLTDDESRPLRGATVEIWHCDALGRYSGFPPPGGDASGSGPDAGQAGETFLRGRQATDPNGMVEFATIYPGWYPGRTVHIHLTVHTADAALTSQLYFPDEVSDLVLASPPYGDRPGRDTTNTTDEVFPTGGDPALVDIARAGGGYRAAAWLVPPPTP
jgi:protocatechuate 3,4-dioxygenase beta subunit